jgi:hypothetical protein
MNYVPVIYTICAGYTENPYTLGEAYKYVKKNYKIRSIKIPYA